MHCCCGSTVGPVVEDELDPVSVVPESLLEPPVLPESLPDDESPELLESPPVEEESPLLLESPVELESSSGSRMSQKPPSMQSAVTHSISRKTSTASGTVSGSQSSRHVKTRSIWLAPDVSLNTHPAVQKSVSRQLISPGPPVVGSTKPVLVLPIVVTAPVELSSAGGATTF